MILKELKRPQKTQLSYPTIVVSTNQARPRMDQKMLNLLKNGREMELKKLMMKT